MRAALGRGGQGAGEEDVLYAACDKGSSRGRVILVHVVHDVVASKLILAAERGRNWRG